MHATGLTLLVLLAALRRLDTVVDSVHSVVVAAETLISVAIVPRASRSINVCQTLNLPKGLEEIHRSDSPLDVLHMMEGDY